MFNVSALLLDDSQPGDATEQ